MLSKRKSHAFNKDCYLLGMDDQGVRYWLESPSWDCNWYWGFGYIETYTLNDFPNISKDINTHQHWDGFLGEGKSKKSDYDYCHHINESRCFVETVLTDEESWEISDLMSRFYTLKEMANIFHSGTSRLTSNTLHKTKNDDFMKWINELELPALMDRVIKILSPN